MTKIDCNITVNFLREHERMCNCSSCGGGCPVYRLAREDNASCGYYLRKHPEFAVEIVQKWSDEHPVKTRLDDLLEKYPKFQLFSETGRPMHKPRVFGYCDECIACPNNKAEHCWNEPVDGGATGKEVE